MTARLDGPCSRVSKMTPVFTGSRAVNTGSVYRVPVFTGRVGKKQCRARLVKRCLCTPVNTVLQRSRVLGTHYRVHGPCRQAENTGREHG